VKLTPPSLVSNATPSQLTARPIFVASAFIAVLFCGGCTALRVNHRPAGSNDKATSVPGVPFYPKKARCRQEVVWFEPIYTLTLAALLPDKDGALQSHPRGAVVLSRTTFQSHEVNDFVKLLNNRPSDENTVVTGWKKVVALADSSVLARDISAVPTGDRILAGRSSAPLVYVDYSDQYYINAKVPLAGSANVDVKVADDGSLSEASGQVQNNTLQTILSALPISSAITGGLGLPGGKAISNVGEVDAFQLTVAISGYRHTLARLVDFPNTPMPCPVVDDIPLASASEYKREDITAAPDPNKTDKTGNKNPKASKDTSAQDGQSKKDKPD
jgi:hypothetical protein